MDRPVISALEGGRSGSHPNGGYIKPGVLQPGVLRIAVTPEQRKDLLSAGKAMVGLQP